MSDADTSARPVWPQTLIVVHDVVASSRFYVEVLGVASGHGGDEYEQLTSGDEIVMQLHRHDVDDHHGPIATDGVPFGNGVLLWFELTDFDAAVERVRGTGAEIVRGPELNPNAKQHELWFKDPEGYTVVITGPSEYRPR